MTERQSMAAPLGAEDRPPVVYLCQVTKRVSCGACCGLYNVCDPSRDALTERLVRRTAQFAATPRTERAIERFPREIEGWTPEDRPLPRFHHCPFLGLIGARRSRVGCLLHPAAPGNRGRDWRYLSYYGAKACRTYFCPAGRALPARYLHLMQAAMNDWYHYGLFITEHRLLRALFEILERHLVRPLQPAEASHTRGRKRLEAIFDLLLAWPYRAPESPDWGPFPFENGLYLRPKLRWPSTVRPPAPYPILFRELGSVFATDGDLQAAVNLLESHLKALVADLRPRADDDPSPLPIRSAARP
jgi:hypothetical protein